MADIKTVMTIENEQLKKTLKESSAEYKNYVKDVESTQNKLNSTTDKLVAKQKELANSTGTKTKQLKEEIAQLKRTQKAEESLLKTQKARVAQSKKSISEKEREIRTNEKAINVEKRYEAQTQKTTKSVSKHSKATNNLANETIRYLRWAGTIVGVLYAVNRAWDMTIGKGIQVNKMMEDNTSGIGALFSANTKMILSNGEVVDSYEKFAMGQELATETMDKLRTASIKTYATFPQLTEIYQQAIGQTLSMGDAFGDTVESISDNTIKLSQRMSNIAGAIGMPMDRVREEIRSLLSGNASTDSLISTMLFGSPSEANKAIRIAKEKGGGAVTDLMNSVLAPYDALESVDSYTRSLLSLEDAWSQAMKSMSEPVFDDLKDGFKDLAKLINDNKDDISDAFSDLYDGVKLLETPLASILSIGGLFAETMEKIGDETSDFLSEIGDDENITLFSSSLLGLTVILETIYVGLHNSIELMKNLKPSGNVLVDIYKLIKSGVDLSEGKSNTAFDNISKNLLTLDDLIDKIQGRYKSIQDSINDIAQIEEDLKGFNDLDSFGGKDGNLQTLPPFDLKVLEEARKSIKDARTDLEVLEETESKVLEQANLYYKTLVEIERALENNNLKEEDKNKLLAKMQLYYENIALLQKYSDVEFQNFVDERQKYWDKVLGKKSKNTDKSMFNGWDRALSNTLSKGIQDAIDGDFNFGKFASSFSSAMSSSMISLGIGTSGTRDANGKVITAGTGLIGGDVAGGLTSMGYGIAISAVANELTKEGGLFGSQDQSGARRVQAEFDAFMDGLNQASDALNAFGNVGSSFAIQYEGMAQQIKNLESTIGQTESYWSYSISGAQKKTRETSASATARNLTAVLNANMTSLLNSSLGSMLDFTKLTVGEIDSLIESIGLDVESAEKDAERLNELALLKKQGLATSQDIQEAQEILLSKNYKLWLDYSDALKISADSVEEAKQAQLGLIEAYKEANIAIEQNIVSTIEGILRSLDVTINGATNIDKFNQAMRAMMSAVDNEAQLKALGDVSAYIGALTNPSNFQSGSDMAYAQAIAKLQLGSVQTEAMEEIDYLKIIAENTGTMAINGVSAKFIIDEDGQVKALIDKDLTIEVGDGWSSVQTQLEAGYGWNVPDDFETLFNGYNWGITDNVKDTLASKYGWSDEISEDVKASLDSSFGWDADNDTIALLASKYGWSDEMTEDVKAGLTAKYDWNENGITDAVGNLNAAGGIDLNMDLNDDGSLDVNIQTMDSGVVSKLGNTTIISTGSSSTSSEVASGGVPIESISSMTSLTALLASKGIDMTADSVSTGLITMPSAKDLLAGFAVAGYTPQSTAETLYTNLLTDEEIKSLTGWASGGYTGDIGTSQVAGVVHGQEYVVNAQTTKDLGLNNSSGVFEKILARLETLENLAVTSLGTSERQLQTQRATLSVVGG